MFLTFFYKSYSSKMTCHDNIMKHNLFGHNTSVSMINRNLYQLCSKTTLDKVIAVWIETGLYLVHLRSFSISHHYHSISIVSYLGLISWFKGFCAFFSCRSLSKQSLAISRHLALDSGHCLQHKQPLLPQLHPRGDNRPSRQL